MYVDICSLLKLDSRKSPSLQTSAYFHGHSSLLLPTSNFWNDTVSAVHCTCWSLGSSWREASGLWFTQERMAWGEGGVHDGREHMTAQSMQIALAGTKPGVTFQSCPQSPLVLSRSKSQRLHNLSEEYSWPGTKCSHTGMAYILYSVRIPHKDVSYHVEPSDRSLAENCVLWHLLCFLYVHSQPQFYNCVFRLTF